MRDSVSDQLIDLDAYSTFEHRRVICGDMWPPRNMSGLSDLQIYKRIRICNRNMYVSLVNATGKPSGKSHDIDMIEWAAWGNAEELYHMELIKRLGGTEWDIYNNSDATPPDDDELEKRL